MPLQFLQSLRLPFPLQIGRIIPFFQSGGITPVCHTCLITLVSHWIPRSSLALSISAVIPHRPGALPLVSFRTAVCTPNSVMVHFQQARTVSDLSILYRLPAVVKPDRKSLDESLGGWSGHEILNNQWQNRIDVRLVDIRGMEWNIQMALAISGEPPLKDGAIQESILFFSHTRIRWHCRQPD